MTPTSPVPPGETLISVDIEAAGPHPADYSMLSIGACVVDNPDSGFYVELKPLTDAAMEASLAVGGLSMERLSKEGLTAVDAMRQFEDWIELVTPRGHLPVFVGFNAPFDWMFVDAYFHRFLGRNPFGHSALDIKAYYMGAMGGSWSDTSMRVLSPLYLEGRYLSHNALGDARDQAELFRKIRADAEARRDSR
ncbi:MAG: 3'-5' exonuclease [Microbacteriaceae bacterium]|nr:3'-5' exonuclease [Microbacteriaceae bacterium]